jgi:Fuc2NAc and GlcNAc transferase
MIIIAIFSFVLSFFLSWILIKQLGGRLLDIPNDRSSHSLPTPRGGGIAITITATLASVYLSIFASPYAPLSIYIILLVAMATLGAFDDFMSLSVPLRLAAQLIFSLAGTYFCFKSANFPLPILLALSLFATFGILWLTNLYNFMDGINGIATMQAIFICGSMAIILHYFKIDKGMINLLLILGFASAGFLFWNFPSAKIFMGDSGSLFLGFAFGLIAVKTSVNSIEIAIAWLIIMAVFITDATYTLFVRFLTGQKFYLPHRSHSYQKIAIKIGHTKTTLLILMVNMVWLFPLALLSAFNQINPLIALTLAYLPLIVIAAKLGAGRNQ